MKDRKYIMHSETDRSARVRWKEHKIALDRRESSNLWKHCLLEHDGEEAEFKYEVERNFHQDILKRQ